jgi:hypothetical protein
LTGVSKSRGDLGKALCPDTSPMALFCPRRVVVSYHNYRNACGLQFATARGNGQEKSWPASSSRSAARGENRVNRFFHPRDPGVGPRSSFPRGISGPDRHSPIPENPTLSRVPAKVASAVPQRWSSSCKVSPSFKKVKRRRLVRPLWPHVHRSCRRAIHTARLQPPSPSRGHTRL